MTSTSDHTTVLPTTFQSWRGLLTHLGIRPSKGMGQNFLLDRDVVREIVDAAEIDRGTTVVEIGPGLGIMTEELLTRAGRVIAVELDSRLAKHLRNLFGDRVNFELIEADALQVEFEELVAPNERYQIVANLPYSVAAAITRHALEDPLPPTRMTVMVQKEVAERMAASPPNMSILGVATQFYATARIVFIVPADVFFPRPEVESAVVELVPRADRPLPASGEVLFFRLVTAGFRQKRKQIANSLSSELGLAKDRIQRLLLAAGIESSRRAETISVDEWVRLTLIGSEELLP
ncbi:MAG: 16S rRNA (adenine(1518)-N(6)/adenine(1519)-N(6))-dimethyltransferase RsmA [Thermomicrobiales bacterium]